MDDPWEWRLVSVERRPLGNVASGLVLLVAAFAVTALSRWMGSLAGQQGDVLVIVVAGWIVSLLASLVLSALSMPAYFGRRRALSAGAFANVVLEPGFGPGPWSR